MRYEPGGSTGDDRHDHQGEEAGLVIKGTIELSVDNDVFTLNHDTLQGDSFSFPGNKPHRYDNPGEGEAIVVWANTPITLRP